MQVFIDRWSKTTSLWVLSLLLLVTPTTAANEASDYLVESLPGLDNFEALSFENYAGFMPLNDQDGTNLFFWFVTSQSDPKNDPVLFWSKYALIENSTRLGLKLAFDERLCYSEWWSGVKLCGIWVLE